MSTQYMFLFYGGDDGRAEFSPEAAQAHMQEWGRWIGELSSKGVFVAGEPLESTGKTVRGNPGVVKDGPFAESRESIGGYVVVKADSLDHATALSMDCPILRVGGTVEVRPIANLSM